MSNFWLRIFGYIFLNKRFVYIQQLQNAKEIFLSWKNSTANQLRMIASILKITLTSKSIFFPVENINLNWFWMTSTAFWQSNQNLIDINDLPGASRIHFIHNSHHPKSCAFFSLQFSSISSKMQIIHIALRQFYFRSSRRTWSNIFFNHRRRFFPRARGHRPFDMFTLWIIAKRLC